ncbi:MAG TPA: hypothetical protein VFM29_10325 [Vicinamibacteria bacterium]|nr:hypothetical protein [Vicinamibacteria bacterium]
MAAVLVASLLLMAQGTTAAPRAGTPRGRCCFVNPRFAGVCAVQPIKGETCAGILSYLNNPKGVGKSYCGNTTVRGGWSATRCQP